jgi:hypothetical protein
MTHFTPQQPISIPVSATDRQIAEQFAQQQLTAQMTTLKAQQVYLNTLAVLSVNHYLSILNIPTHLEASESWNPVDRLLADVADLSLGDIGRLECRPLRSGETDCNVPPDVWADRIGYVAVELDQTCHEAKLLGFIPTIAQPVIAASQLQPLDALLEHLHHLQQSVTASDATKSGDLIERIQQRAANFFGAGWQRMEELFAPPQQVALSFRHKTGRSPITPAPASMGVCRGKLIDLGMQLSGQGVALVIEFVPRPDGSAKVLLQVHPLGGSNVLPPNLQLQVLSEFGTVLRQVQSRTVDNYIQLELVAEAGEQFNVRVALGQAEVTEQFVV